MTLKKMQDTNIQDMRIKILEARNLTFEISYEAYGVMDDLHKERKRLEERLLKVNKMISGISNAQKAFGEMFRLLDKK